MEKELCDKKFGDNPNCLECPYPKCSQQSDMQIGVCHDCQCPEECLGYTPENQAVDVIDGI